ncbi:MAG TPA: ABC transporter ATP-binding protein [Ktedonobacterales bacterium]|nr:ABC transporter ATP-binding protein [Ktedonobacterales bacterium]
MHGIRLENADGPRFEPRPAVAASDMMPARDTVLLVRDLVKRYHAGGGDVMALRHVNLMVREGQFIAIRGRSGAGKTTLLNLIAGLDDPTSGHVNLLGRDLSQLTERQRTELRRHEIGFVFQSAHLFPALTARENVEIPLRLVKTARGERGRRSHEALTLVGLAEREQHRAPELSGGEQQRVAIARALVHAPRVVLADEPTGNLDSHTGLAILDLMLNVAHRAGIAFIITTHDPQASHAADAVYDISDGVLSPGQR